MKKYRVTENAKIKLSGKNYLLEKGDKIIIENVKQIKNQLTQWAKNKYNLNDNQINDIITQLEQEEQEWITQDNIDIETDKRYIQSQWAKQQFQKILEPESKKQKTEEDQLVKQAKKVNTKYYQWVLEIWEKEGSNTQFDQSWFDYLTKKNINPTGQTTNQIAQESEEWHTRTYDRLPRLEKQKLQYKTQIDDPKLSEPIKDMFMVTLISEDERIEGKKMGHCVGDLAHVTDDNHIFSLRDKDNQPHATIEVKNEIITQIKGKRNKPIIRKYVPYVLEWINKYSDLKIETLDGMLVNEEELRGLIDKFTSSNVAMHAVAYGGHIELVELVIGKGADVDMAMSAAAEGGNIDIVELMIRKGATNFNEAMSAAAYGGHTDIVELMINPGNAFTPPKDIKGATNFGGAMILAAFGDHDHIELVELMIRKGARNFNEAMAHAAEGGHIDIVELMINPGNAFTPPKDIKGATNFDADDTHIGAMRLAANNGHDHIVEFLKKKKAEMETKTFAVTENIKIKLDGKNYLLEKGDKIIINEIDGDGHLTPEDEYNFKEPSKPSGIEESMKHKARKIVNQFDDAEDIFFTITKYPSGLLYYVIKEFATHYNTSNITSFAGESLLRALVLEKPNVAAQLLKNGMSFNINETDGKYKNTALHIAMRNNNLSLIRQLIEHGADLYKKNKLGYMPKDFGDDQTKEYAIEIHNKISI